MFAFFCKMLAHSSYVLWGGVVSRCLGCKRSKVRKFRSHWSKSNCYYLINQFPFSPSLLGTNPSPPVPLHSKAGKHLNSSWHATLCKQHLCYLLTCTDHRQNPSFHIMLKPAHRARSPGEFLSYNDEGNIAL